MAGFQALSFALVAASLSLCAAVTFTPYFTPTQNTANHGIALGPDGNLWFCETNTNNIGRMTLPTITFVEFAVPTPSSSPIEITAGPDGNMWFIEMTGANVAKISLQGQITEYAIPSGSTSGPRGICAGPDGNVWFTEWGTQKVAKITTGGIITEYPLTQSTPHGITAGPDGNLWFTLENPGQIGKITPAGVISYYPCPDITVRPTHIVSAGGYLWYAELAANKLGRVTLAITQTTSTVQFTEFTIAAPGSPYWYGMGTTAQAVYVVDAPRNLMLQSDFAGVQTIYNLPVANCSGGEGFSVFHRNNLWIAEGNAICALAIPSAATAITPGLLLSLLPLAVSMARKLLN